VSSADLEQRMRETLLQLALCSNGTTTSWAPSGSSERDRSPTLGIGDAPELELARAFDCAVNDQQRERVLGRATETLDRIRRSRADASAGETLEERNARIVRDGEGVPARDVAIWARCGIRDVHKARDAAGRDLELGRPLRNGELRAADRRVELARLVGEGMSVRNAARSLGCSESTARRDLGLKA
jgi:hypothetical protein